MTQHFFGAQISYQFATMHTVSYEFLMKPEESAGCHQTLSSRVGAGHETTTCRCVRHSPFLEGRILASSPGPAQKSGKGPGVTPTFAKIPVCAVSAVFVWSRGITFIIRVADSAHTVTFPDFLGGAWGRG